MRLEYRVYRQNYRDGTPGYRIESLNHHGIGNRTVRRMERTLWVDRQFHLKSSVLMRRENDVVSEVRTWWDDGEILVEISRNGHTEKNHRIPREQPVYLLLHPLMYAEELTQPGQTRSYDVLLEEPGLIQPVRIRYVGEDDLFENGQQMHVRHYQLEAATALGEFDDYYIDPDTTRIIKIQFGQIKFIPTEWVD